MMTKAEAIQAMEQGYKVTHRFMELNEYVMLASDGSKRIENEEGYIINPAIFWHDRRESQWELGWEITFPVPTDKNKNTSLKN